MLIQKCLMVQLLIGLNEMTRIPKLVPHWYVPGFETKFPDIEITGFQRTDYELQGDLREEAARMHAQFGEIAETGQPVFDAAYGIGNTGLVKLRDLIKSKPGEKDIVLARDVDIELGESITLDDEDAPEDVPTPPQGETKPSGDGGNSDPLADAGKGKDKGKPKG